MAPGFIVYDLAFLVLFTIGVVIFLNTRKHNLKKQGLMYLYRTKLGILFMDRFAKKFSWFLKPVQYLVLASGYILMVGVLWLLAVVTYDYYTKPIITELIKAPPIAPLIPYFPTLFGLDSFFPPLYFTYFLIALAVVAIAHEAAHGIFARLNNIRIHSTGFAFLGPILGAFVEQDEKQMNNAKKFPQMVVLAAGTFANVLMTVLFGLIAWLFFSSFFVPAGIFFNSYSTSVIEVPGLQIPDDFSLDDEFVEVSFEGNRYFASTKSLQVALDDKLPLIAVYEDTPAFNAKLSGAIMEIDGAKVNSVESLSNEIKSHSPGDIVKIKTAQTDGLYDNEPEIAEYNITLGGRDNDAFLGVGISDPQLGGVRGSFANLLASVRDPFTYYESSIGDFGWFVYYLLWWLIVINIVVAFFNMMPLGILDGGRFFMLSIWSLTGSERIGIRAYKIMSWIIGLIFLALMIRWVLIFV
jgi:membrane-associated protease RseP (regulator of RpoE activity)